MSMSCLAKLKNRGEWSVSLGPAFGGALALFVGLSGNGWAGTASYQVTFESRWSAFR